MNKQLKSFNVLSSELLNKLEARGCSSITITGYRYLCNSIISWLQDNGYDYYCKVGGSSFLQEYLAKHGENQYYTKLRTTVYRLNNLVDDMWKDVHSDKGKHFSLSYEFSTTIDKYCNHASDIGLATGTIRNKRYAISWLLHELGKMECNSVENFSPKAITMACTKITDHNLWGEIRVFLRHLVAMDEIGADYSTLVPHYSKPCVLPSVYSIEEIKRIEKSVDTSTVIGKRDYAIILLASRMGLRSGDIVKLKIEDVRNRKDINIIQEKTRSNLHLPIINEVRTAIDDYLSVRPMSIADEIFINVYAPYKTITTATIRNALKKYLTAAGIDTRNRKKGPHVLRSSLASSMVNDDISYETVRKVLGHSSNSAIKHYARIDVEKLRQYCLEPPITSGKFKAFLYGEVI